MTISICNRRLREIGVRKVMGGTRMQLMRQMLSEALVVVVLSTLTGMVLAYPIVDWFNETWKFTSLTVHYGDPALIAFLFAAIAGTTLLAGSYPAFYISGFKPSSIFRGGVLFNSKNIFSRVMMGLQVSISLVSVIVGVSFARNAEFNRTADIGFDYQPILQAWLPEAGDYQRFENEIKDIPGITATAPSQHLPGFAYNIAYFQFQGEQQESVVYEVGNNFAPLMKIRLSEGEWPAPAGDTTASREVVVNQTFVRKMGIRTSVIGEQIRLKGQDCRISGVVSDFLTQTPFAPILPAVLRPIPTDSCQRCVIRTAGIDQQPRIMDALEQKWKKMFPYVPFNVGYQNEMMQEAIEASDNIAKSMAGFAMVAILLCITGLFSLVSLNVMRRLREVAIRRVMGASGTHISWILNKNYVWIFAAALLIGCVGGRFLALLMMDSIFKFNIGVQPQALIYSTLGILSIAAITIGVKIWQTLRINPAEVLRGE
jgi:ABC-type lipoprotein release transport system permease subunit